MVSRAVMASDAGDAGYREQLRRKWEVLENESAGLCAAYDSHPTFPLSSDGSVRIVSAIVSSLLLEVFAALNGVLSSDSSEILEPALSTDGAACLELPGPAGSFFFREGWPAVDFIVSDLVRAHAKAILRDLEDCSVDLEDCSVLLQDESGDEADGGDERSTGRGGCLCGLALGLADASIWAPGAEGCTVCGCQVCWLVWRQERVLKRRYLANASSGLRRHTAAKNIQEVVEDVVFFNLYWRLRSCLVQWREAARRPAPLDKAETPEYDEWDFEDLEDGNLALAHRRVDLRGGDRLENAGFLVAGGRWWDVERERVPLREASLARWPTLPVVVPDFVCVMYAVLFPAFSVAAPALAFRRERHVQMRDQARALEERRLRESLRALRLRPGGVERWWGSLVRRLFLRDAPRGDPTLLSEPWQRTDSA